MPGLPRGIVRVCFFLLIFFSEKFSTWVWRLPFAINVNLNLSNDLQVAHPHSGSSSTWFLVELEFGNVGFWGEGKTGVPGEKPRRAKETEPTTNSTHIWRRRRDLNPGHIGGRRVLSLLGHPCSPIDLFSWYILFSQKRSCDNTPKNCFFQISSYSRAFVRIIYEKTKGQVPL